jgi:hypothetical protein
MKTIPTCSNEIFMETLCIENFDNLKNVLGRVEEKMQLKEKIDP